MVLLSGADNTLQPPQYFPVLEGGPAAVRLADLDADGRPDLPTPREPVPLSPGFASSTVQAAITEALKLAAAPTLPRGYFPAK